MSGLSGIFLRFARGKAANATFIGILIILAVLYCYARQPRLLRMLDYKVYDTLLYARADGEITPYPIIIDLDEASLEAYGQWPWPRFLLAEVLRKLETAGVASVGMDMLLSEEDRSSPRKLQNDLSHFLNLDVTFEGLPRELYDYDQLLARSLRMSVVLGMYCHFDRNTELPDKNSPDGTQTGGVPALPQPLGSVVRKTPGSIPYDAYLNKAPVATLPLQVFWETAPVGMINMSADLDGVVRRLPLVGLLNGNMYANLGLRTLMAAKGQSTIISHTGPDGLDHIRVGKVSIPVAPDGTFTVPYRGGAKTFPYYSAKDILEDRIPAENLRGKIAFLGTSAPGLLDIRISPLERVYPGVEVHATVVDAILAQTFLRVPAWTPGLQAIAIIFAGVISTLAFGFARSRIYIPVALTLLGGAVYGSRHFFMQGFILSPLYICLTIVLLGAALLVMRFWQEERQKNVLRSAFSRYVAPEVVERISRLEGDIFAGEERELSIMFTDIRGFTSISEKLLPQQIVMLLNRYFTPMTALVRANKGTLDKFIGDALMAFWNAPVEVPGHPRLATLTALQMQEKLTELNIQLERDFGIAVNMGVGVHTGKAYVGNMGSEELLNYTLIGDNVNLASRLEGLCARFGVSIVVSAKTKELCTGEYMNAENGGQKNPGPTGGEHSEPGTGEDVMAFLPLDTLRVKGKKLPVSVFSVMRPGERAARSMEIEQYLAANALYNRGDFSGALKLFSDLESGFPGSKLYAVYKERCSLLSSSPPPAWDGVWTLTSK